MLDFLHLMSERICQSYQKEKNIEEEKIYLINRYAYILLILIYSTSVLVINVLIINLAV